MALPCRFWRHSRSDSVPKVRSLHSFCRDPRSPKCVLVLSLPSWNCPIKGRCQGLVHLLSGVQAWPPGLWLQCVSQLLSGITLWTVFPCTASAIIQRTLYPAPWGGAVLCFAQRCGAEFGPLPDSRGQFWGDHEPQTRSEQTTDQKEVEATGRRGRGSSTGLRGVL